MAEPEPDAGDVDEAEEAFGGFVVAGCQAAAVFQLVEAAFGHVAQGVDGHVDNLAHLSVLAHGIMGLFRSPPFCARRMMMGADHGAINHLEFVWRDPGVVQRVQDVLPQSRQSPAAELTVDRRPLAELLGQVAPRRTGSRDPENPIQNKTMIRRLPPVRVPDAANEALEEGPLIVGYQVARQVHLPRRDALES